MRITDIIEKKRDGKELSTEEINFFIEGICSGSVYEYQASALLMAICIRGLDKRETADLTMAMARSGDMIDLSEIPGVKVDKHSTGGVGDKTTLVAGPIVAACGVPVAKMSGRGLGHTGGTIDKLESIRGFRTSLSREEFIRNVKEIGIAISGQTGNLAPADKILYSLRDLTATISSVPLIASSVMSKKLASGADRIVLDVKTGSGAFMKTLEDSIKLAEEMVSIGELTGRKTATVVTDMDTPLGNCVGNALEVREAIEVLRGRGPEDLKTVCCELAARMLELGGKGDIAFCRDLVENSLKDGSALKKFGELAMKQGAEYMPWDERAMQEAVVKHPVKATREGYITSMESELVGKASMLLGAGRKTRDGTLDHSAGIILYKKTGDYVRPGETIAELHTSSRKLLPEAEAMLIQAYGLSPEAPAERPLILAYVDSSGVTRY
ncbi:MAG: thymidine phosphorylase [Clostridiaceae bacterium]|jgi:pyrimidine-nucleoside phosphorylase|nr:thymidine phosphorylase [Clostridiaceae bacterium]